MVRVQSIDSLRGEIYDSISDPQAYFIGKTTWYLKEVQVAVKRNNEFLIFYPPISASDLTIERVDFNGTGSEELVIRWTYYAGHTGWEHSIHEHSGGIQVWDLDSLRLLFNFENYYSMQAWWREFAEDTTGTIAYSDREEIGGGGESECTSFLVEVSKQKVIIRQNNHCPDQDASTSFGVTDNEVHIYELKPVGLVRKN